MASPIPHNDARIVPRLPVALVDPDSSRILQELTFRLDLGLLAERHFQVEGFGEFEIARLNLEKCTNLEGNWQLAKHYQITVVFSKRRPLGRPRQKSSFLLKLEKTLKSPLPNPPAMGQPTLTFLVECVEGTFLDKGLKAELREGEPIVLSDARCDQLTLAITIAGQALAEKPKQLDEDIKQIKDRGLYSDCTIVCSDATEIKAHKAFLALKSKIFTATFEASMRESHENILELPFDAAICIELLDYVYLNKYPTIKEANATKLLELAHVYELNDLLEFVVMETARLVTMETALHYVVLADRYKLADLEQRCLQIISQNVSALLERETWPDFRQNSGEILDKLLVCMAGQMKTGQTTLLNPSTED